MWKKILKTIGKSLFLLGFELLFKAMDKNKDGKISKSEIKDFLLLVKQKQQALRK